MKHPGIVRNMLFSKVCNMVREREREREKEREGEKERVLSPLRYERILKC